MPKFKASRTSPVLTRNRRRSLVIVACLLMRCLTPALASQERPEHKEAAKNFGLARRDRLEGSATLRTKGGATAQVHANIHHWSIPGRQTAELPEHGFLVVQLRAGRVSTIINGKEEKRRTGDFWTVPANSKMSVRVTSETALLEVMSLTVS